MASFRSRITGSKNNPATIEMCRCRLTSAFLTHLGLAFAGRYRSCAGLCSLVTVTVSFFGPGRFCDAL